MSTAFTITPVSAPTASAATYYRAKGTDLQISVTNLLAKYTTPDAYGDPVELVSVAGGSLVNDSEIAVTPNGTVVYFANPYLGQRLHRAGAGEQQQRDLFVCGGGHQFPSDVATGTITIDVYQAHGQVTGSISTLAGSVTTTWAGIPGNTYMWCKFPRPC